MHELRQKPARKPASRRCGKAAAVSNSPCGGGRWQLRERAGSTGGRSHRRDSNGEAEGQRHGAVHKHDPEGGAALRLLELGHLRCRTARRGSRAAAAGQPEHRATQLTATWLAAERTLLTTAGRQGAVPQSAVARHPRPSVALRRSLVITYPISSALSESQPATIVETVMQRMDAYVPTSAMRPSATYS